MLSHIIAFSVKQKLIVGLFIIGLIGYGSYELTRLPIDAVPDITNNQVQIITTAPSLGATDIERLVTFPIEQANSNISGVIELRSFSRFGLSVVTLVFNDETDIYWARQQVAERLQQVQKEIPSDVNLPTMAPVTTGLGEIYQYVIRPEKGYEKQYDMTALRTIQDWTVRRELLRVEGIAEVSSFGGNLKQYEISIDPNKLHAFSITIHDIFNALENNNQNTGGAYIEKDAGLLFIRSEGLIGSPEDIGSIAIKPLESGTSLLIRDVAQIKTGHAIRYGALTYNGVGEVSGAVVMMVKGGNSSEVIRHVKEKVKDIQKMLPEGVVLEPFLDRTKMVNNSISTVKTNLMEGALIVVFVLVLFLGNFRAGLLVASVIPLAMLFAVIMMNWFGVSGNLMSLGALDFGLIVDGAVIIVEATMHQLSRHKSYLGLMRLNQDQMDGLVKESAGKMMNSAVFGQVIILIVYLPIFTLQGIEGKMFTPMAQTVAFALVGAFLLSLTYIPMMSTLLLSKTVSSQPTWSDRIMERLELFYQHYLVKALRMSRVVLVFVGFLFVLSLFVLTRLGGEFIPALEEGDFAVETRVLTGSNLGVSVEACLKAEKILLDQFPEVNMVVAKTGSSEIPTDPMPIEASDLMVILKDKSEWTSATTFNELAEKMKAALEAVPGVSFGFQYPVQMRFNELMTGGRQDVVCKIFGENLDSLSVYANRLGKIVRGIDGTADVYVESVIGMPQIVIKYNRSSIAQYGLSIRDINNVVNASFSGQMSGLVYEGEKRFQLVVRMDKNKRTDLSDVENLLIPTPQRLQIPLHALAEVQVVDGPNQIQREETKRRIVVGFNVRGRDVQSIVEELKKNAEEQMHLSTGYSITYGGAFKNLEEAKTRLAVAVPVALLLIFILLYFAFHSVKQGLLIYTAIPLSAIGGILALALRGMPFSISAGVGFIALFGVAVLNGIVLIAEFNRLKAEGYVDLKKIVLLGTKVRIRPILMTAFVASLGFLPMALSNGAGAEVQRPLATVVIGGLMLATFLTLFLLPMLYILFNGGFKMKKRVYTVVLIAVVVFSGQQELKAQNTIALKAAIDTAVVNNLILKNESLKAEYQQRLMKTAASIPQANVQAQYGQFNSAYLDNSVGISQGFEFPTVYFNRKKILKEEWNTSVLNVELKEAELKKQVTQVFNTYVYLDQKRILLQVMDSIYTTFLTQANLRLKLGESNVLEKASIENQRYQIANQWAQVQADMEIVALQFQLLLNSGEVFLPKADGFKMTYELSIDSSAVAQHPLLKRLQSENNLARSQVRLARSKFLPNLMVGYNSATIYGIGADGIFYTHNKRFQTFQAGIGIPLFVGANKGTLQSAKISSKIAENNLVYERKNLENQYAGALKQHQMQQKMIEEQERFLIPNSTIIAETANKQFKNGEINYLEWGMLVNQSIAVKNNYLDAVFKYNENIIQLIYLSHQ